MRAIGIGMNKKYNNKTLTEKNGKRCKEKKKGRKNKRKRERREQAEIFEDLMKIQPFREFLKLCQSEN